MNKRTTEQTVGYGITEDDMARIEKYLQKESYVRTVDDLRPSSKR